MKNDLWFQKWHKEFCEFSCIEMKVMLDKSSVYNVLAEGMCFLDKSSASNFNFLDFRMLVWICPDSKMHWFYAILVMPQFPTKNSRQEFLKIRFPKDKVGGEKYDLIYQNSLRKYEDDLEHLVIYIWYDLQFF